MADRKDLTTGQQTLTLQQTLDLALQHHTAGELSKAESIYQQILETDPNQMQALHLLGVIAHQRGENERAVGLIERAIAFKPDVPEAHSNLGLALQELGKLEDAVASYRLALDLKPDYAETYNNLSIALCKLDNLDEAVASCRKAIALKPDFPDAHNNLGIALQGLGRLKDARDCFRKALDLRPEFAAAHYNLGRALMDLGKPEEAISSYEKAIEIEPNYIEAYNDLGNALQVLAKPDEAIEVFETALRIFGDNLFLNDQLIEILNYHRPNVATNSAFVKAQEALQKIDINNQGKNEIPDENVQQLYQHCHDILTAYDLGYESNYSQIYRGVNVDLGCGRHFKVFNKFKIIPENCFGCYKIYVEPRTVVELIKLLLVFDSLEIPNDNVRKCMVEHRPGISGTYKGYIYCRGLEEAEKLQKIMAKIISEKISSEIPVSVKRGCSEFSIAYPSYGYIKDGSTPPMSYNKQWREKEIYTDENLVTYQYPLLYNTHNHSGLTLRDAIVFHAWVTYATALGDLSYRTISLGKDLV